MVQVNQDILSEANEALRLIVGEAIAKMIENGTERSTVSQKIEISLEDDEIYVNGVPQGVIRPVLKYESGFNVQIKGNLKGDLDDECYIVYDENSQGYVCRHVDNGQLRMDEGSVIDASAYWPAENAGVLSDGTFPSGNV